MSVSPTIGKSSRDDGLPLQPRLPGLLLHLWWWSQATGSYHTGGWLGLVCLKIHIIASARCWKKCRKTKRLKSNLIKQRQFLQTYISNSFFLLETNEVLRAFFWAWKIWCWTRKAGTKVEQFEVGSDIRHRWFHQTRIPLKKIMFSVASRYLKVRVNGLRLRISMSFYCKKNFFCHCFVHGSQRISKKQSPNFGWFRFST